MPPGFQIKRIVEGRVSLTIGSCGKDKYSAAISEEKAGEILEEMLADYQKKGILVNREEYVIVSLGDVPFVKGCPPPSETLPSCYRR